MQKEYKLSRERWTELEKELSYLRNVREKEVAEQIKEARSFGDLSENSEYDEAKTEQGKVYSRIAEIEYIISHAVIIEGGNADPNVVGLGSKVEVEDLTTGEKEEYHIVGSQEANPMQGRISEESLFGRAIIGKRVGEEVKVNVPAGELHYKITAIKE